MVIHDAVIQPHLKIAYGTTHHSIVMIIFIVIIIVLATFSLLHIPVLSYLCKYFNLILYN